MKRHLDSSSHSFHLVQFYPICLSKMTCVPTSLRFHSFNNLPFDLAHIVAELTEVLGPSSFPKFLFALLTPYSVFVV